ncbi:MAG: CheR family methyltransferase [Bacteroidales bacterium]
MKHEDYLINISYKLAEIFGLNFQSNQLKDMERRLQSAAKELKINSNIDTIYNLISKTALTDIEFYTLSANLTIGETYFFRENTALDLFKNKIIPELISQRQNNNKQIRIWSAGCSSGEEPYSLAILLNEYFPELSDWDVSILATDISPVAIQKALKGEYTNWSFRETGAEIKNKYFTSIGNNWEIDIKIKKMVTFSYLNLSKNSFPSSLTNTENIDVIFCRNVMMYFTPQVISEVSNRFYKSLNENAWLITSQVELNDAYFSVFERINYKKGIFYQKREKSKPSAKVITSVMSNHYAKPIKRETKKIETLRIFNKPEKINTPDSNIKEPKHNNDLSPAELYQKGQYQKCIECCLKIIIKEELNNEIFALLIKSYANSENPQNGIDVINKIILNKSVTHEMYYLYAVFLNEQNDTNQTEIILKKAIYLNHKHVLSHLMLGDILYRDNRKQLAIKQYANVYDLLKEYDNNEIVPDSEGLTAGRIKELAENILNNL